MVIITVDHNSDLLRIDQPGRVTAEYAIKAPTHIQEVLEIVLEAIDHSGVQLQRIDEDNVRVLYES